MRLNLTNVIEKTGKENSRKPLLAVLVLFILVLGGCSGLGDCVGGSKAGTTVRPDMLTERRPAGELIWNHLKRARIPAVCRTVYEEAVREEAPGSLEMMREMVAGLGKAGYTSVDSLNQVDMVNPEIVLQFCETVEAGKSGAVTIIVPNDTGGLIQYDLKTAKGRVEVVRQYAQYENGFWRTRSMAVYPADVWQYTEEGYLLFGGSYYTAESYALVMDDEPEHVALRVAPLAETCRELNRQYILPAGYRQNNLFLTDWSEENFADVDFYDIFDVLYVCVKGRTNPYAMALNPNEGIVYSVPEEEFEAVIMRYFKISRDALRSGTLYVKQEKAYEYRPRGFYESGYSDIPYPEVVSYKERPDGTIEMTVNAVYPYENKAKAFTHKVVVRPLQDGSFQYVSNRIVTPEEDYDIWWYDRRLPIEKWKEIYEEEGEEQ